MPRGRRPLAFGATANTGQVWKDNRRTTIETWGGAPVCTEPVRGQVTLRGLSGATKLTGTALDADDQPAGEIAVRRFLAGSDEWTLDLTPPRRRPCHLVDHRGYPMNRAIRALPMRVSRKSASSRAIRPWW